MTHEVDPAILAKEEALKSLIASYAGLAVAYSGGVDSTYLADVAHEVLGPQLRLVLADSPSIPRSELNEARAIAANRGWPLDIIQTTEFENPEFLKNERNRCYICKGELFKHMRQYAQINNIATLAYGETADDTFDATRVGKIAADENNVVAPLLAIGLKKEEIRHLSRRRGLPTWDKASFACLASRFPKGRPIEVNEMSRVEQAEELLKNLGFRQYRARHHGDICRIEVELQDLPKLIQQDIRQKIVKELTTAGYKHITLDLAGYRTGSTAT